MKKTISLLVSFSILMIACDTDTSITNASRDYFMKFYGLDGDQTGDDLVILPDGNLMIFGSTRPSTPGSPSQWYLVKTDPAGNVIWEKEYGGPGDDEARDIEISGPNEVVLAGNTYTSPTDRDVSIMRVTTDGTVVASVVSGFTANTDQDVVSVSVISDGYIISGSTNDLDLDPDFVANDLRDAIHLRYFSDLTIYPNLMAPAWRRAHGPGTYDVGVKVVQITPTDFYFFGYTNTSVPGHANPDFNYWVFGLGPTGEANTIDTFWGSLNDDERMSSFCLSPITSIEGYLLGGTTRNAAGLTDFYITKLRTPFSFNSNDELVNDPLNIALGSGLPEHTAVTSLAGGGFLVLGNEVSFNNDQNWVLTKIDFEGFVQWSLPLVFGGEGLDECGTVTELPDGRILVLGTMRTGRPDVGEFKMTLLKVSANGKFE